MNPLVEAGLWVVASLGAKPAAQILWPRLRTRIGDWGDLIERAAPWLHALVPLYLSLMTGAVLGWGVGLYGFGLDGSLLGALAGLLFCAVLYGIGRFPSERIQTPIPPGYEAALQDELRWAFYRGAAVVWLGEIWLGGLLGWGLAVVEWLLAVQPWKDAAWKDPQQWATLMRAAASAALFMLSRNLWLVLAFQILALWVWSRESGQVEHDESDTP
jgi:hypothetical protein